MNFFEPSSQYPGTARFLNIYICVGKLRNIIYEFTAWPRPQWFVPWSSDQGSKFRPFPLSEMVYIKKYPKKLFTRVDCQLPAGLTLPVEPEIGSKSQYITGY